MKEMLVVRCKECGINKKAEEGGSRLRQKRFPLESRSGYELS